MRVENLVEAIKARFPSSDVETEHFDSGAFMMDIRIGSKLFVCSYSPSNGFGVDQVTSETGFDSSFRHHADTIEEAETKLIELIDSAQPTSSR